MPLAPRQDPSIQPHNSPVQQPVPSTSGIPPQTPPSMNTLKPMKKSAEKVKLRKLTQLDVPQRDSYLNLGQKLDFLLRSEDNPTIMRYCQYEGGCTSEVSRKPIPQGHRNRCLKHITQKHVILQSSKNQLSFYNHELQPMKTLDSPGWVIGVISDLYAVVKSIIKREGHSAATVYITSLANTQEIHHELKLPSPKAKDVSAILRACGSLDGRVAITKDYGQYIDFYSTCGHNFENVDLKRTGGPPSCTEHHVLVPVVNPPTVLVFTWTGKLVQHLELSDLGWDDSCLSISPVHEGKLNVWVKMPESHKVITYEIEECKDEDDDEVNMDNNGQ